MIELNFEPYYIILWILSFFTAMVSGSLGFVGGTILLVGMAQFIPAFVLIPLHGLIQLFSNVTRSSFLVQDLHKPILLHYIIGIIGGSIVGSFFILSTSDRFLNLIIGVFAIISVSIPRKASYFQFPGKWTLIGFVTSSLGLFVGAVGVIVGSMFLTENLNKKQIISTQAVCQAIAHFFKLVVYFSLGFALGPWLVLVLGMLVATLFGSYVGVKILDKIPGPLFLKIFRVLVLILGLRLIWIGF